MWFKRDFSFKPAESSGLPIKILLGPRQVGKTALLLKHLEGPNLKSFFLDDLSVRTLLESDPRLHLEPLNQPILIDESQYAPAVFNELKFQVDQSRRTKTTLPPIWMTGSSGTLLEREVKESLAGRASLFKLHSLSVHELDKHFTLAGYLIKGGWPELYVNPKLDPSRYLDDYIRTFIERDVALGSGVHKLGEFLLSLKLLAGRTGQILNASEIGAQAGVKGSTLQDWLFLLERNQLFSLLQPYSSNLNKRLIKTPKIYCLDVGLATRLQGWRTAEPILSSPAVGPLFESMVYGELIRIRDHSLMNMDLYYFRTKEGEEIDFLVRLERRKSAPLWLALESKFSSQNTTACEIPESLKKLLPEIGETYVITPSGKVKEKLGVRSYRIPIMNLYDFIHEKFET